MLWIIFNYYISHGYFENDNILINIVYFVDSGSIKCQEYGCPQLETDIMNLIKM